VVWRAGPRPAGHEPYASQDRFSDRACRRSHLDDSMSSPYLRIPFVT
jgi:hypothetical protein